MSKKYVFTTDYRYKGSVYSKGSECPDEYVDYFAGSPVVAVVEVEKPKTEKVVEKKTTKKSKKKNKK